MNKSIRRRNKKQPAAGLSEKALAKATGGGAGTHLLHVVHAAHAIHAIAERANDYRNKKQ